MSILKTTTLSLAIATLVSAPLYAGSIFPRGCEVAGFGYDKNNLILNETGDQSYYLIQNRSDGKIELERHDTAEAFMSPPLFAAIEPTNWAAFASDVKNVNFKCYKRSEENTALIDCRDVLEVCQYPRARFALSNMGNYWISVNKAQQEVIQESVAKGIYLKW